MEAIVIRLYFMKRMMLDGNIEHDLFEVKRQQIREDQKDIEACLEMLQIMVY